MSQAIDKLLSLASSPLGPPVESTAKVESVLLQELVSSVLSRTNGFHAFESALHVFPLTGHSANLGIDSWNAPNLWQDHYGGIVDGFLFFAEDVFGGQFGIKEEVIYSLDPETGEAAPIARSVEEWARNILDDWEFLTGYPLAHQWQVANGRLSAGERLLPKKPFVLGGEYDLANLTAMDAVRGMRFRGDLAVQIRDMPNGATITFKTVG